MSTPRFDLETLISDIEAFVRARLNTKLLALNTEKNDGLTLPPIDTSAYVFNSLDGYSPSYDPFVFIGISNVLSQGIGPATRKEYLIDVAVIISADQDPAIDRKRVLRFNRAVEEIFNEGWSKIASHPVAMGISSLTPTPINLVGSSAPQRAVGVQIKVGME